MKRFINKKSAIITSVVLLLLIAVGATLAYVFTSSGPVENTFKPSNVACAVVENGSAAENTDNIVTTGTSKTNVQIKNTGDTDAYIRVAVVVNWMSADGSRVWAQKPVSGVDYTITYDLANGWFDGGDGFYYYSKVVSPTDLTSILIKEATLANGAIAPVGTDGTQYYLSVEIIASAIQSAPASTVSEQWDVVVSADGTISKQGG